MLTIFKVQLFLLLTLFLTLPVIAEITPTPSGPEKYINVTVEVHGLEESVEVLKNATLDLAKQLNQLEPDPKEMTPEQLQALSSVIQESNRLIQTVDDSIHQSNVMFESLISDSLLAVNKSTIEPTIQSIDSSITKWLMISFLSLLLLVIVFGYYLYLSASQIRVMASTLKSITEDYEIVPKHIKE